MEIFLFIVIVVLLIIILNKQQKIITNFQIEIRNLTFKLDDLKNQIDSKFKTISSSEKVIPKQTVAPLVDEKPIVADVVLESKQESEVVILKEEVVTSPIEEIKIKQEIQSKSIDLEIAQTTSNQNVLENQPQPIFETKTFIPKKSWFEKFKEKNPDLEKFIGENLISKIGILILVLGISFFVKYAIDRDWINEPARVGIGILAGGIVMAVAHRLRKNFAAFSSVFVAGAISIFYFTIGIAFHDYQLFSQTVAFVIMVVITIFSALVSVSYNRRELAILTLIGGFSVPFMVSTGSGNYQVLFGYIAILNIGMLIISFYKKWNIVTLLAFIFSSIIYISWFVIEFNNHELPYQGAFVFATIMYIIFSIAAVINNVKNKGVFTKIEYIIMLVNTFFYFGVGATVFQNWHTELKGIFTISLAFYNLIFSLVLYRKFGIKKDAIYFLLGLALTFITLTIPFQFNGNYITLFWACEAVLLLWLSQKSKISTFRVGAIVVQFLMIISLFLDWTQTYSEYSDLILYPFLNKIFVTGLLAIASFVVSYFILKKENEPMKFYFFEIDPAPYKKVVLVCSLVIGYLVGMFEIIYQTNLFYSNDASILSYAVVYHYVFTTILVCFLFKFKSKANSIVALILSGINILFYLLIFHRLTFNEISNNFNYNYDSNSAFIGHYVILVCIITCIYILIKNRKEAILTSILDTKIMLWIFAFCVTFILSNEIMVHSLYFSTDFVNAIVTSQNKASATTAYFSDYERYLAYDSELMLVKKRVIKVGFPILWGLLSFIFLIIGIKKQIKQLRIIALALLGLTVLKLFIFDINVSGPGRIVAFILLGILVLIISFVYQKLNKKNTDESKQHQDEKDT
ncbi:DUF2339 domain-containing protein [Flavobacterium sp. I3-2]|uniref:DUF2339 domain-containing protein n=1 Tax=Flavobacterium sp. I3-2 TaxID=2748319 RepID=UPI0015AD2E5B|nr:DUF2339 domain-containing protein [Flavobacterium sp. I3-2]